MLFGVFPLDGFGLRKERTGFLLKKSRGLRHDVELEVMKDRAELLTEEIRFDKRMDGGKLAAA